MSTVKLYNPLPNVFDKIPETLEDSELLVFLGSEKLTYKHFRAIKKVSNFADRRISSLLDISEKTFRNYKNPKLPVLKKTTKERTVQLLTLFKHGYNVFGSTDEFSAWLNKENFILDGEKPISYLDSSAGINFIDDKLTAMEYGDF